MKQIDTKDKILDSAEDWICRCGFNAFSYKDIANDIGIKTSSIHYHFPTKVNLVKCIMQRRRSQLKIFLANLEQKHSIPKKKLEDFFNSIISYTYLADRKMCLGAMLAIDVLELDNEVISEVKLFFSSMEEWIAKVLDESGLKNSKQESKAIVAQMEGALLLSRLFGEQERIDSLKQKILSLLG